MAQNQSNEQRVAAMQDGDLVDVMQQTTAYAYRLVRAALWRGTCDGVLPDGMSAVDLSQMALEKVLQGAKWDSDKPLWLILQGLVRGWIGNLKNGAENRRLVNGEDFSEIDEGGTILSPMEAFADPSPAPGDRVAREEDDNFILEFIDGLEAGSPERLITESIFSGVTKRNEILADTGLTAPKFEAAKKRLRRLLENYRQKRASAHH